jgi:hypothetical protein
MVWLDRAIMERRLTLYLAGWAARSLHDLPDFHLGPTALRGLSRL